MYMRVQSQLPGGIVYPELAGNRVLITGLRPTLGVDIARALADHGARLALHTPEMTQDMAELIAFLAQTADQTKHFDSPLTHPDDAVKFAQGPAIQAFGGLDLAINLIAFSADEIANRTNQDDIEDLVATKLAVPVLLGRVLANRMRLTLAPGLLLNIVTLPAATDGRSGALNGLVRAALANLTRGEATQWAEHGIRINAVGPPDSGLVPQSHSPRDHVCEADIAALALYLASEKAQGLSGHVFDPQGLAAGGLEAAYI
ncbi:MAG: SDR family oxidoreductase [Hyphomicrobiaceae bacterium]